jgi:hypothetical protein
MNKQKEHKLPDEIAIEIRQNFDAIRQLEAERMALLRGWMAAQKLDKTKKYEFTADYSALIESE